MRAPTCAEQYVQIDVNVEIHDLVRLQGGEGGRGVTPCARRQGRPVKVANVSVSASQVFNKSQGILPRLDLMFLEHVWDMLGTCSQHVWDMFGTCLGHVWVMLLVMF